MAVQRFPTAAGASTRHIVHIADSDANSYIRRRRFIAEAGESLAAYDENKWAVALDYHNQDMEDAPGLFKLLRRNSYKIIKDLPEKVWSCTTYHSEDGKMSLDDWLDVYEGHILEHIQYMQ